MEDCHQERREWVIEWVTWPNSFTTLAPNFSSLMQCKCNMVLSECLWTWPWESPWCFEVNIMIIFSFNLLRNYFMSSRYSAAGKVWITNRIQISKIQQTFPFSPRFLNHWSGCRQINMLDCQNLLCCYDYPNWPQKQSVKVLKTNRAHFNPFVWILTASFFK